MRTLQIVVKFFLVGVWLTAWSISVNAQPFDSGSNGSYGPMNIAGQTVLLVPSDGIFHVTTMDMANVSLSFTKNAANTPVYILATGDITINGNVFVSGSTSGNQIGGVGGPGGFDGGARSVQGTAPGDGHGPGGGKGGMHAGNEVGSGSFATQSTFVTANNGDVYGTALMMPMVGGSGGGGSDTVAGGGGGGAIMIASNTKITLNGAVFSQGGHVTGNNDGSGGSVRLVAPKIAGAGKIYVDGAGGWGRARIDLIDRSEFAVSVRSAPHVIGSLMQVFPTTSPSLAIIEAAGKTIIEGSTTPVEVHLPNGAPSSQDVIVQARDFTGLVPIRVKVIPDSGPSVAYDDTIDMGGGNPSTVTVSVQIPVNVPVMIEAWTTNP